MESSAEVVPLLTTASRAERATIRAAREMARRQAEHSRLAHIELNDGLAITKPELERLTTCHRSPYRKLEWRHLAARTPAPPPVRTHEREKAARRALATWQPTWQERMFGDEAQRRRQLTNKVFEAARADEIAYVQACRAAEAHNAEALMARRLLELDPKAIKEAVALKTRLVEVREGMNGVSLAQPGGGRIIALVDAIGDADVPHERITDGDPRSARRELISFAERRQIHLAAVCAVALRVGADLVSVVPVEAIEVVVECPMADPEAGRPTPKPALQLLMTVKALGELEWMKEDAVTLATSLGARMDWSIERGFAPIRPIPLSAMGRALAQTA